jgi:hypothetical protein
MVWHVVWQPWSARSYGEERTRARETMTSLPLSIPPVTLRKVGRPYHETGKNPRIVTLRHSSTSVLKYACTIVRLYYVKKCNEMLRNVTVVRLYYYPPMRIESPCFYAAARIEPY